MMMPPMGPSGPPMPPMGPPSGPAYTAPKSAGRKPPPPRKKKKGISKAESRALLKMPGKK